MEYLIITNIAYLDGPIHQGVNPKYEHTIPRPLKILKSFIELQHIKHCHLQLFHGMSWLLPNHPLFATSMSPSTSNGFFTSK